MPCCPVPFRLSLIFFPRAWDGTLSASVDGLQVDILATLLRPLPIVFAKGKKMGKL